MERLVVTCFCCDQAVGVVTTKRRETFSCAVSRFVIVSFSPYACSAR
jgi:hypothetical protein